MGSSSAIRCDTGKSRKLKSDDKRIISAKIKKKGCSERSRISRDIGLPRSEESMSRDLINENQKLISRHKADKLNPADRACRFGKQHDEKSKLLSKVSKPSFERLTLASKDVSSTLLPSSSESNNRMKYNAINHKASLHSEHQHTNSELSSSDSVPLITAIGHKSIRNPPTDINHTNEIWYADELQNKCNITGKASESRGKNFDVTPADEEDTLLNELNSHLNELEGNNIANKEDEKNDYLSPARLHTFGLAHGSEVLRGIEKARQEMIREMEAQERAAQEQSESSVREPVEEEDPEKWKRWQEAKRLLQKVREQEQKLMGADVEHVSEGSEETLSDALNVPAMQGAAGKYESPDTDPRLSSMYNMTFENLAAGLLEMVRRISGVNSSAEAKSDRHDESSQSSAGRPSSTNGDSSVIVERNKEEGVRRWVDANEASAYYGTPAWKRIGRSKRKSRTATKSDNLQNEAVVSVQDLFLSSLSDDISNKSLFPGFHEVNNQKFTESQQADLGSSPFQEASLSGGWATPTAKRFSLVKDQDTEAVNSEGLEIVSGVSDCCEPKTDSLQTPVQVSKQ